MDCVVESMCVYVCVRVCIEPSDSLSHLFYSPLAWFDHTQTKQTTKPNNNHSAEVNFRDEAALLKTAIEQHEAELRHMESLQQDQKAVAAQIAEMESFVAHQQNALQLEARSFDFQQKQHFDRLLQAQKEFQVLQVVQLHSTLFDLVVDKRGLHYPFINEFRLAFCPKGDVEWAEINAGWSQATQLLFLIGSSLEFRTQSWRIVPLTQGAKLMHLDKNNRKQVYNMGSTRGMAGPLRAFHALLEELGRFASSHSVQQSLVGTHNASSSSSSLMSVMPFPMTRTCIGTIDLSKLPDTDDPGWSRAIHCTACNLQYLSDVASAWEKAKLIGC